MSETQKRGNRWPLVALAALFVGPLALAWILYFTDVWRPEGLTHHGTLLEPAQSLLGFTGGDSTSVDDLLSGKWSLIQVTGATCDDACSQLSERIRQVRLALTHRRERVQRILIATENMALSEDTDLRLVNTSVDDPLMTVFDQVTQGAATQSVFVTDPLGNLVLVYPATIAQKALLEDLKRLLRLSRIG